MSLELAKIFNDLRNTFDDEELLNVFEKIFNNLYNIFDDEELLNVFEKIKTFYEKKDKPIYGKNCLISKSIYFKEGMIFIYYIPGANKENIDLRYKNFIEGDSYIELKAKNDYLYNDPLYSDRESSKEELSYYSISDFKMNISTLSKDYVNKLNFDKIKTEFASGVLKVVIPFKEDDILYKSNKIEIK